MSLGEELSHAWQWMTLQCADGPTGRLGRGGYLLTVRDEWEIYIKRATIVFVERKYVNLSHTGPQ
jgi:hypothetical protein